MSRSTESSASQRVEAAKALCFLLAFYLSSQLLGIACGKGTPASEGIIKKVETREIVPIVEEPEKPIAALEVFAYILVATALLMILLKFGLKLLINLLLGLALLVGLGFVGIGVLGTFGLFLALGVFCCWLLRRENVHLSNLVVLLALTGIGSYLGSSLPSHVVLILLILLAIYDVVAVFYTKHMVVLARSLKGSGSVPLMVAIPAGGRTLHLGAGDLALPVAFSVSVLREFGLTKTLSLVASGTLGFPALLFLLLKLQKPLPALPPIIAPMIATYGFIRLGWV